MTSETNLIEWLVYYLIAINLVTFLAFGLDKMQAEGGGWRFSETSLLGWALLGGSPGAFAGRAAFRHKTQKQPFTRDLHWIAALQVILILAAGFYALDPLRDLLP